MRLYLAHPIIHRHEVREQELLFERTTDIELINPFYDTDRQDIGPIDAGRQDRYGVSLDIVENDLRLISECDGLLYVPCGHESIGSAMEIAYAHQQGKPVYIIEPSELSKHVWLRYHATAIYPAWEAFAEQFRERRGNSVEDIVQDICASIRTYSYHEVRNALLRRTFDRDAEGYRANAGCTIPTDRQLAYILSRSDWSRQIVPPTKHRPAKYEYRGAS